MPAHSTRIATSAFAGLTGLAALCIRRGESQAAQGQRQRCGIQLAGGAGIQVERIGHFCVGTGTRTGSETEGLRVSSCFYE